MDLAALCREIPESRTPTSPQKALGSVKESREPLPTFIPAPSLKPEAKDTRKLRLAFQSDSDTFTFRRVRQTADKGKERVSEGQEREGIIELDNDTFILRRIRQTADKGNERVLKGREREGTIEPDSDIFTLHRVRQTVDTGKERVSEGRERKRTIELDSDIFTLPRVRQTVDKGKERVSENRKREGTNSDPFHSVELDRRKKSPTVVSKMHSHVQIITTPTSDTPGTALILNFNDARYIIGNAHEGLQRACIETGRRLIKTKAMFLTGRTEWKSNGGLLGMILTLADATISSAVSRVEQNRISFERKRKREEEENQRRNKEGRAKPDTSEPHPTPHPIPASAMTQSTEDQTLLIHGGSNLNHMLATARSFIFRKGMPIKVIEHVEKEETDITERDWEPTWSDRSIQVWAMPIKPSGVSEAKESPEPGSPRKQSLGEYMGKDYQPFTHPIPPKDQQERDQELRKFAVSEMFSSQWDHNDLVEMPLRDVKMPGAIFIRDSVTRELSNYKGPLPDGTAPMADINVLMRRPRPGVSIDRLPRSKPSSIAMSYIIRNHKMRGKFRPDAAEKLNVPPGSLRGALASGSSVQTSEGVTVTPDMVLEPSKEGSGIAVIDLPSSEYVHDLVHRAEWRSDRVMVGVVTVIWILGPGVAQDETLCKFIEGQSGVQHIISSPEQCPNYLSMNAAAAMAICHNRIDPERYTVPIHCNAVLSTSDGPSDVSPTLFKSCRPAKSGLRILLEPKFSIQEEQVVPILDTASVFRDISPNILELSQVARRAIDSPEAQAEALGQDLPSPDAEMTFLGTGSAAPSRYRNVSATLLRVPGCGSYLMDCGENTLGQLKRMYTPPQLAEIFQDLKLIWISHLHADHHLGLTSVIKAWYEQVHGKDGVKRARPTSLDQYLDPAKLLEDGKRLFVVGNQGLTKWLEEYSSVEDYGFDQLVPLVSVSVHPRNMYGSRLEWNNQNVGFKTANDKNVYVASVLFDMILCDSFGEVVVC